MKTITFLNVENLIFLDSKLRNMLPDFQNKFYSWSIAQQNPELRPLAQKMLIDFVNQVEEKHLKILKNYFNENIKVERVDSNVAKHLELSIYDAENYLNSNPFIKKTLFAYREKDQLYISMWR